ncbi:MAG: hypothetical protein GC204_08670 [Chloroflexi bacterium]|nr:hypothetical protein [Chloroflexota bacterium]
MHIEVKLHRSLITSENTIEDIEMTASDFVRRDDDHRPALAALHAELSDALDAAEEATTTRIHPTTRYINDLLQTARGRKLIHDLLTADEAAAEAAAAAGQGSR